ncbi:VCBS domain-containing protein, partial [Vibrio makurazakiensis]|uniref:VCBS domain-containing protein n=1 Tax=Vibrio makurazakiensis TaxID=2910250 RepID=UPI003D1069EF
LQVTSLDGTATETITVNILGSNDGATITPSESEDVNVVEVGLDVAGDATAGGQLLVEDVDDGEAKFQDPGDLQGEYGTFTFDPDTGVWGYTLDPDLSDPLNQDDAVTDSLQVTSLDGTATETITVNILGTNDGATITPSESEDVNVVEVGLDVAGDATAGGQLLVEDVDDGEAKFQDPGDLQGEYGTFTFDPDTGVWGYTLDPDLSDPLNQDDAVTDSLQVTSLDGTATETITVNILGTNDGATITPSESEDVNVVEVGLDVAGDATAGGQLLVEDVDDGEAKFQDPGDLQGEYGTFTFDPDTGVWGYTLDPDLSDPLNQDDAATDSLQVTSLDGTATETITVNILGTNDGATITPSESEDVNVVEVGLGVAGDATAGGQLLVEDVDDGEAKFQDPGDLQGEYGTFTFDPDTGVWGYTLDPDLSDPLNQDDAVTDSLQVTSLDGTATETITVNILGTNDGATITPSESEDVNVVEVGLDVAGDATAGGQLLVEDVDDGEAKFQDPGDLQGEYGTFTFDPDTGVWGYTLDPDLSDPLNQDDAVTDSLQVTSLDGTATETITVNILGTNDGATITPSESEDVNVVEVGLDVAGDATAGGQLLVEDVDDGEAKFQDPGDLQGEYGTFTFDPDTGVWGYTLDPGLSDPLNQDDAVTDSLQVTSLDGTATETITVNILGTNDGATITPSESEDVNVVEVGLDVAGDATAGGQLLVEDVDDGEAKFQDPGDLQGEYGTFTFNTDTGVWGYTLDPDLSDPLNQDDAVTDSLQVTSLDGTATETITVNILGSNDGATITPSESEDVNVVEVGLDVAGDATAGGQLLVEDVDDGEAKFQDPGDLQGEY